jgi:hypothetical protein
MNSFVGTKIHGYCDGCFGRDDYDDKIIILEGKKWIVCAYLDIDNDRVTCANFDTEDEKIECIKRWMNINHAKE